MAVITGRSSAIVQRRMQALGVQHIYQGQGDKMPAFDDLLHKLALTPAQAAYIGDDVIDLPVMRHAALGIAVSNAHPLVQQKADWITRTRGGYGAVREACDLILQAQGLLDTAKGTSVISRQTLLISLLLVASLLIWQWSSQHEDPDLLAQKKDLSLPSFTASQLLNRK